MKNRRITLQGAYYGRNFGDLLLLQLQLAWLEEAGFKRVHVPTFEAGSEELLDLPSEIRVTGGCSGPVLFGGGGYLGAPSNFSVKWAVNWMLNHGLVVAKAAFTRRKVFMLGTGVGPLPPFPFNYLIERALRRAEVIQPRDQESADCIRELVGRNSELAVGVGTDLAIWLASRSPNGTRPRRTASGILGLHLAPPLSDDGQFELFLETLGREVAGYGFRLRVLVDQSKTKGALRQRAAGCAVATASKLEYEVVEFERVDDFVESIAECDRVITSKLHVGIVGRCFGVGVLSIPTHLKTIRFYRQIGEEHRCWPWGEHGVEKLISEVRKFLDDKNVGGDLPEKVVNAGERMRAEFRSLVG